MDIDKKRLDRYRELLCELCGKRYVISKYLQEKKKKDVLKSFEELTVTLTHLISMLMVDLDGPMDVRIVLRELRLKRIISNSEEKVGHEIFDLKEKLEDDTDTEAILRDILRVNNRMNRLQCHLEMWVEEQSDRVR